LRGLPDERGIATYYLPTQMKSIASFFAAGPAVESVKAEPLVFTSLAWALAVVPSLIVQTYVLVDVNTAEPAKVTVLGPFEFGIVNVPVTTCCDVCSVPAAL
jgi:hypothetical protein